MRWNEQKATEKPKKEKAKEPRKMPTPGKGEYDSSNLGETPVWKR